jgi:hypothetical protein
MHEMALAESILNIVEETARRQGAARVTEVRLEIGELANVESEALQFGLEAGSTRSRRPSRCASPVRLSAGSSSQLTGSWRMCSPRR